MPNFILEKEHKDIKERLIKEYIKKQNNTAPFLATLP